MLWILFSALGSAANAGYFIAVKRLLATTDRNVLAAGSFFITGIFLLLLALVRGIPPLGNELVIAVIGTSVLNIIATTLVYRALPATDISLAVPMISFTPVFLIVSSFLILGEIPTLLGIAGICVIVTGSYLLNLSQTHTSLADPFRAILRNRGSISMLAVAFIYSISLNFDKMVVLNSDPVFGSALVCLVLGLSFFIIRQVSVMHRDTGQAGFTDTVHQRLAAQAKRKGIMGPYIAGAPAFTGIGIMLTIEMITINYAFTLQIVPYVIAIKRMSIILMVFYGTIIAHEGEVIRRLAGAGFMVAGAILIILSG
ncbi:MAG: EamA-like transporter family protein [Methanoregula sp. PtaU1.Bin051]|nr:MAG: EamA-like transporter family protein [Methanoregula sp. PtaU1.Bin051]